MSKTSARHQALQEFLSARGYATIEELARHFEVTPQTVRKDINALAEEGKVQRFHGGAGMVSGSENIVYDERKGICQEEKRRIGALLATHIPDGVSVCINIGLFIVSQIDGMPHSVLLVSSAKCCAQAQHRRGIESIVSEKAFSIKEGRCRFHSLCSPKRNCSARRVGCQSPPGGCSR